MTWEKVDYESMLKEARAKIDPERRKGQTCAEWAAQWNKSEPWTRRMIRGFVTAGKWVRDEDWRELSGRMYLLPVYRPAP